VRSENSAASCLLHRRGHDAIRQAVEYIEDGWQWVAEAAFPEQPPALAIRVEQRIAGRSSDWAYQFSYLSEADWRLWGELRGNADTEPRPLVIVPRMVGDKRGSNSTRILEGLDNRWLKARIDPRGTGNTA